MKRLLPVSLFLAATTALLSRANVVRAQDADAHAESPSHVNLALVAVPNSSYVSGDTSLVALHDGVDPRSSRDARRGSYGNWPRRGRQWVEYEWSQPVSTREVDIYWWDDRRGVRLPQACQLLYWDGVKMIPVPNASGLGVTGNQYNRTSFDEISTTRLRLEIESNEDYSTGVLEWKVYDSGASPNFPPTVNAGRDRVVMLGGKTYLTANVKALKNDPAEITLAWSKDTGPGEVTFADHQSAVTTANFAAAGDYVLRVTAGDEPLQASSLLRVRVENPPSKRRLDVVYTKNYRLDSPLWNARAKTLIVNWIPHCIDQINRADLSEGQGGIDNFVEAAKALRGEPHGSHKGYVFSNAWVHQTVESMCLALMVDAQGDSEILQAQQKMRATLEDWIPKILAAQEPDGYLQTAYTLAERSRWPERWSASHRADHEGYVAGYFLESAINHYTLTDGQDQRLYNAAKKLADCWVAHIGPDKKLWYDGHQEMEQALVRFGRFVNDMEGNGRGDAYVALAKFLLDCRQDGSDYDQSHAPVQQQYEAVGHAVRAVYSYSGMADVAAETGDMDYQSAVMSLWDNIVNRKYYVTGGIGSGETSEGFGPDFSLRHNAYCESCSSCGLIFFQYKLNLAYHDAKFADLYEETMYNALLGAIDLEGRAFNYTNPLVGGRRTAWHACPCCVGNIPRTLLMVPTWTYVRADDAVYVNLYIGSTVQVGRVAGTDLEIVQKTDYPWNGKVALTVHPQRPARFAIYLRVPNRQTSSLYQLEPPVDGLLSLTVNDQPILATTEAGYVSITREWQSGDTIQLELPLKPQRIASDERVAANRDQVALRYGPLIYCVERTDQDEISQPIAETPLTAEWRPELLQGVTILRGNWADGGPLRAIPYYARQNRPAAERSRPDFLVWLRKP